MAGPPMLHPTEIDGVLTAARARAKQRSTHGAALPQAGRSISAPANSHGVSAPAKSAVRKTQSVQLPSGTGINPWWRYQESSVPGDGRLMINVGAGNVLLQDDDMEVPHKGIALAFRRTYNSQSLHDVNGDEGGIHTTTPGMYGNGWTNTFDAHLVKVGPGNWSVYDIDGARYDYVANVPEDASAGYTGPPGQHALLASDGQCGMTWTKKSGTIYYFYRDNPAVGCPALPSIGGYAGRLYQIIGRNRNTSLTFTYSWDNNDASATGKVSGMSVTTESGLTATLSFADVGGHRLLQQLIFPDGVTTVNYSYDSLGNLVNVSRPPNNAAGTRPSQSFGYVTLGSGSVLRWASSPRWCAPGCGDDGAYTAFAFAGTDQRTSTISAIARGAVVNPSIPDGSNSQVLQPGVPQGATYYDWEYYSTGVSTPTFRDTDGHATNWVVDSAFRPTQTQECTTSVNQACSSNAYLTTNETWDSDNNLVSEVDPRGGETDYLHDPMGNTTAVGEPYTATAQGSFKPTQLYDYDAFNNVIAYCDANEVHAAHADWTPPATPISTNDAPCSSQIGAAPHWRATYAYPSYEPYGELTSMTTPLGYTRTIAYAASQQAGADYGLPTAVSGAPFTQVDGSTITPAQTFWYDVQGSLRCYSKGNGTSVLSYDALGRMLSVADADDSSANGSSSCGKSTGISGWNTQTTYTYFPDGSKASQQTPSERAGGVATTFTYDLDGEESSETHHFGCVPGTTCTAGTTTKWYDGADRLVEVRSPADPADAFTSPWLTRYLYDLSGGGTVSMAGTTYRAYGGLFKTIEWVPPAGSTTPVWLEQKGQAFDALDRQVAKYSFSPSSNTTVRTTTMSYDAGGALGLLSSTTDPLGEMTSYAYDALGHVSAVQFSGDGGVTPAKSFTYDADGRQITAVGAVYGTQTTHYDADGRVSEVDEPTSGSITSPARLTYDYYGDGSRKDLNVSSSALTAFPYITYAYRADGAQAAATWNQGGTRNFRSTYTDAGRLLTRSDPYTGTVMPSPRAPVVPGTLYTPLTRTYDTTGQLTNLALPTGLTYSSLAHDDEGHLTQWVANTSSTQPAGMQIQQSTRGETGGEVFDQTVVLWRSKFANGMLIPDTSAQAPLQRHTPILDPVNAIVVGSSYDTLGNFGDQTNQICGVMTDVDGYDAASRLVSRHVNTSFAPASPGCDSGQPGPPDPETTTYDAENHTLSGTFNGTASYGPNGKPYIFSGISAHFDGDQLLFMTNAAGAVTTAKLDLLAETAADGTVNVLDRDTSDFVSVSHNATSYQGITFGTHTYGQAYSIHNPSPQQTVTSYYDGSANTTSCAGGIGHTICSLGRTQFMYGRPEGFNWGTLTIQGARATDSATGLWTTPDAYAGDVHDPMSQKPFMWDNNNPYEYSDASGFYPGQIGDASNHPYSWDDPTQTAARPLIAQSTTVIEGLAAALRALRGASADDEAVGASVSGVLRNIAKTKGNYTIGVASEMDTVMLGRAFVGRGATLASDGTTLVSKDGTRVFRPPSFKPSLNVRQANFQTRTLNERTGQWKIVGNAHMTINPSPWWDQFIHF